MRSFLQLPIVRSLHARGLLFVAILLPIVAAVLLAGAFDRREPSPAVEPETIERPASSLLNVRPTLEKTPLTYQADYWLQLAERTGAHIVQVGTARVPAIVVEPGLAVTSATAIDALLADLPPEPAPTTDSAEAPVEAGAPEPERTPPDAPEIEPARLVAVDWDLEMALIDLGDEDDIPPFTLVEPSQLHPGALAAAITRASDGGMRVTPGHVVSAAPAFEVGSGMGELDISLSLPRGTDTAAIVDLDGRLVGVALQTAGGIRLLSNDAVINGVVGLRRNPHCLPFDLADVSEDLRELLRIEGGILIERVRHAAFVPEPSIQAGDVLTEWDRQPIASVDQFAEQYVQITPGTAVRFVVLRGERRIRGTTIVPDRFCLAPGESRVVFDQLGLTVRWAPPDQTQGAEMSQGVLVEAVASDGPAAGAGLEPSDRILAADGAELSRSTFRRTLERLQRSSQPAILTVRRGDRVRLVAISPAAG